MGFLQAITRRIKRLESQKPTQEQVQKLWNPNPGPQTLGLQSQADELLYGGAAGGGKSDLLLGIALTQQTRSVIYRREYPQLRAIIDRAIEIVGSTNGLNQNTGLFRLPGRQLEFASVQYAKDVLKQQGRPRDFIGFDEAANFTREQYRFLIGWCRSSLPGQRCRVVLASNPPTTLEGRWLIDEWAPWLDEKYPDPAAPSELRWYTVIDGELQWFRQPTTLTDTKTGDMIRCRSRTFIPALLEDNPALRDTGYRAVLQAMPEPLRSQLLYGSFRAGLEDSSWQVIPTAWVRAAMARWTTDGGNDYDLDAVGVDIARGGNAKTVVAKRRGPWLAPLDKHPGASTPDGQSVLRLIVNALLPEKRWERATINVDPIGVGASVIDLAREYEVRQQEGDVAMTMMVCPVNFASRTDRRDRAGLLRFANIRAAAYWNLRDLLDPASGENIALPPDQELLGDLCAVHWEMRPNGVTLQPKSKEGESQGRGKSVEEVLGRSPDCGDAVVYAFWPAGETMLATAKVAAPSVIERAKAKGMQYPRRRVFG